jgi:hypothetical protein
MEPREKRRDRTYRYSKRAQKIHLRRNHPDGVVDCVCELADWYFRKGKAGGCRCRRARKGNPKVPGGLCSMQGKYHDVVRARIDRNRMVRDLRRVLRDHDPEDFEG